jgi:hypothetical protein
MFKSSEDVVAFLGKQGSASVVRTRDGFAVSGGDWPKALVEALVQDRFFPVSSWNPDKVSGTAEFTMKVRGESALVFYKSPMKLSWSKPVNLTGTAGEATFSLKGMGLSKAEFEYFFKEQFSDRTKVISLSNTEAHLQHVNSAKRGKPVEGLISLVLNPSLSVSVPTVNLKRDGILKDAKVQIDGKAVGSVLVPAGLDPILDDLRGLFN